MHLTNIMRLAQTLNSCHAHPTSPETLPRGSLSDGFGRRTSFAMSVTLTTVFGFASAAARSFEVGPRLWEGGMSVAYASWWAGLQLGLAWCMRSTEHSLCGALFPVHHFASFSPPLSPTHSHAAVGHSHLCPSPPCPRQALMVFRFFVGLGIPGACVSFGLLMEFVPAQTRGFFLIAIEGRHPCCVDITEAQMALHAACRARGFRVPSHAADQLTPIKCALPACKLLCPHPST